MIDNLWLIVVYFRDHVSYLFDYFGKEWNIIYLIYTYTDNIQSKEQKKKILILVLFNGTKIGYWNYFPRFNGSTTRKPFRTTRDAFRHRVNISESMNIVPRAAFTIVLFYFPDAGRTIWIVSDREPSTTVNINGAHKPWRIHLRMSRDELFFFFVAGCTSHLFPVFYFEFRASSRKPIIFHANTNYYRSRFFFYRML